MTTKLLLRAIVLVCAMLGMILQAQTTQPTRVYNPSGKQYPGMVFSCSNSQADKNTPGITNESLRKIEGGECTVTLNLEYDAEQYIAPFRAWIIGDEIIAFALDNGEGALVAHVPAGTYDIAADFQKEISQYYWIKEKVQIDTDITLTLNPYDCVNQISVKNCAPDGQLFKHSLGHWDEDAEEWVTDVKGNVISTSVNNVVYLNGQSLGSWGITFWGDMDTEEMRSVPSVIYVTDVSDRILFTQKRISISEANETDQADTYYCSYFSTDDVKNGELETNIANYVQCNDTYKFTPFGLTKNGIGAMACFITTYDGNYDGYVYTNIGTYSTKPSDQYSSCIWLNAPEVDPFDEKLSIYLMTGFTDYQDFVVNQWTGEEELENVWTLGSPYFIRNGQRHFSNIGHMEKGNWAINISSRYNINIDDSFFASRLLSPEPFIYPSEQVLGIINDNCPINALQIREYEAFDQLNMEIIPYFIGRYGETRWCNEGTSSITMFNGFEVDESFMPESKGVYEITMTNPNIEVDGLPGHNTTTVYFDQNQEDMTPPAVEMLHFKNAEGGITDRFATADDGTMEFYASDFHYQYYPDLWTGVFQCQPVEVTVEYAPYGTEEWNELAVEEIPEYYQEPGWGYFYRGSLAGVTGEGLNGWFDLRFRLQDASGNWMDQVVSPAFRIDDQAYSSVATVGSDNAREVARYNLAGQRIDANTPGVAIIRMSDGTARKVIQ